MCETLTSTIVASNTQSNEDQLTHSRLLFHMAIRSLQQISRQPERNSENETAKLHSLTNLYIGKHAQSQKACN